MVSDLCISQHKNGYEVILISILRNDNGDDWLAEELKKSGVIVIELGASDKKHAILEYIPVLRKVLKDISKHNICILNMHLKLSVLLGCVASAGLTNIRRIEIYHGRYLRYHLQHRFLRPFINKYVAISEESHRELTDVFHVPEKRVIAIPNGIDVDKIREVAGKCEADHDFLSVMSVGRLSYEKNIIPAAEAFSQICNQNIRYTIIGNGPDYQKIYAITRGNEFLDLKGGLSREETIRLMSSADLLVLPSLWEGRSIVQLEAVSLGIPMVISNAAGLRELFSEPELKNDELYRRCGFGYIVRGEDQASITGAIMDFAENRDLKSCMASRILEYCNKRDITFAVRQYAMLYENME
ncbi:MAG: glycosyltransferase [Erysipelotrichaceae bacterium]|nr:glycosyltransferase [Erysipelotrichaceae bacterium]